MAPPMKGGVRLEQVCGVSADLAGMASAGVGPGALSGRGAYVQKRVCSSYQPKAR